MGDVTRPSGVVTFLGVLVGTLAAVIVGIRRAMRWGATPEEVASASTADTWFDGVPGARAEAVTV